MPLSSIAARCRFQLAIIREYVSIKLVVITFVASLNTFSLGYDVGWWSILIAVPQFGKAFGKKDILLQGIIPWKALDSTQLSVGAAAPYLGALLGGPFAAVIAGKLGRRAVLWMCSIVTIVASLLEITCSLHGDRYWQLVGGKGVVGIATGLGTVAIPLYLSEVAPAPIRGAMINALVVNQWLGTFVSVAVGYSVRLQFTSRVWLLPIGIQLAIPCLLVGLTFVLPESPRWLLEHGRREDALRAIESLGVTASAWSPEAHLAGIENEMIKAHNQPKSRWKDCFIGMNFRRTLIAVGVMAFSAGSGLGFVSNYAVLILQAFTDKYLEVFIGILGALVIFVFVGFITQDMLGRRVLLLIGAVLAFACMLVYGIVSTIFDGKVTGAAGVAGVIVITLWLVNFTQTWSAVPFTVFSEIPSAQLREKVIALSIVVYQLVNIVIVFVSPYLQSAQGGTFQGKIGYIYAGISFFSFFFVYFFVPDLTGCSLEEVDQMFSEGVSIRFMRHRLQREAGFDQEAPHSLELDEKVKQEDVQIEIV